MFPKDTVLKEIFRSGSDSLSQLSPLLGRSNPEIIELAKENPLALWREITDRAERQGKATLAKIFYYHTPADSPLMKHFHENCNVIHLIRRNLFDCYVSGALARMTGQWQGFEGDATTRPPEPFTIDRADLEKFLRQRTKEIELTRAYFAGKSQYYEVFYEDIASGAYDCAKAIGKIFDAKADTNISVRQRKQKALPNSKLIANYDDVSDLDVSLSWGSQ
jgi:hypothetical protein